ncbi:replication factor A1 [Nematocida minor]|uniref:replication factor A1 n=1 Tax=Nematocida minor TaxID=1912983 RepID=UPI0022211472|nr:replication factor A1 [Nematocida minor]KAI5192341.1 replication factor A1 [Nematocida minor]
MHIQEAALEVKRGCISKAFKNSKDTASHEEIIVRIVSITTPDDSISQHKIRIVVTDDSIVQECLLSSKYLESVKEKKISEQDIIKIGGRTIGTYAAKAIIYIKEIEEIHRSSSMGSNTWESIGASPSKIQKRKTDDVTGTPMKEAKKEVKTIKELNPFQNASWCIRVKVINKSPIREYTRDGKAGKVFNLVVSDGETKCAIVFFTETVDTFFEKVQIYKTYEISGGVLKLANKRFNEDVHDYEIIADKTFSVTLAAEVENAVRMPKMLAKVSMLRDKVNETVNMLVAVVSVGDVETVIRRKDNTPMKKRTLRVTDESEHTVPFILWEDTAEMACAPGDIILLEGVRVSEYQNDPQISLTRDGILSFNPELPEVFRLRGWYNRNQDKMEKDVKSDRSEGKNRNKRIAKIEDVKAEAMEYATVMCTILFLSEKGIFYTSCPNDGCNKKVDYDLASPDSCYCNKCAMSFEKCNYCYSANISIADNTSSIWVSLFNETATVLFKGVEAAELFDISVEDNDRYQEMVGGVQGMDVVMTIRGKESMYNGEAKMRYNAVSIKEVDYLEESRNILQYLQTVKA